MRETVLRPEERKARKAERKGTEMREPRNFNNIQEEKECLSTFKKKRK